MKDDTGKDYCKRECKDKVKKGTKEFKKKCKKLESNFVRRLSNYFANLPFIKNFDLLNFVKGQYYLAIHGLLVIIIIFITIFNNSIVHLIILLIVISLDAFSIVVLHGCPLTHLEKKYLGIDGDEFCEVILKNLNISYECSHTYERQVELLINIWFIVACKILFIIFFKMFNIELINFNCLYGGGKEQENSICNAIRSFYNKSFPPR